MAYSLTRATLNAGWAYFSCFQIVVYYFIIQVIIFFIYHLWTLIYFLHLKCILLVHCLIFNFFVCDPSRKYILSSSTVLPVYYTQIWIPFNSIILLRISISWLFFYNCCIIFFRFILCFVLKLRLKIFSLIINYAFKRVSARTQIATNHFFFLILFIFIYLNRPFFLLMICFIIL